MSQPPKLLFQYTSIVIFLNLHFFLINFRWELPAVNASSFLPIFSPSCSLTYRKYVVKKALYFILLALVAHKLVWVCVLYTSWPLKLRSLLMGHTWHKDASKRNICETFAACWDKEPKIGVVRCHPPLPAKSSCK